MVKPGSAEVDPQYLKPNALVTSEDKRVRALAQRVDARGKRPLGKGKTH